MLLDDILPKYDFTEVYSIRIKAPPEVAYRAIMEVTLSEISGIVRLLMYLRSLPEKAVGRKAVPWNPHAPFLPQALRDFFIKLVEQPPREIVFGLIVPGDVGRVWKKSSNLDIVPADAKEFLAVKEPSHLWVVCNFLVDDAGASDFVTVRAEFRTRALSPQARKKFTPYWRTIRPFSGLIQKLWLRSIKRRAERDHVKALELPTGRIQ
jgi:hypothetical protein